MLTTLKRPSNVAISLDAAKVRLSVSGSADDALLLRLLKDATSRVEGLLNRPIRQGKYRETAEQDPCDNTLLLEIRPVAAPVVTAAGAAVSVIEIDAEAGLLEIAPAATNRVEFGALEARGASTAYSTVYLGGWLFDEGARSTDGALVEEFALSAAAEIGATAIEIDATDLADDATGLIPAGATLSLDDEIAFAKSASRSGDVMTVELMSPLEDAHLLGAAVMHVDERVPAEIQNVVAELLQDAYLASKRGAAPSLNVSEVSGDGYTKKFRDAGEVDKALAARLGQWVIR